MGNICPHVRKLREDVDAAVDAAWAAWESWKKTTPAKRADALLKIADVIDQNKEKLALFGDFGQWKTDPGDHGD